MEKATKVNLVLNQNDTYHKLPFAVNMLTQVEFQSLNWAAQSMLFDGKPVLLLNSFQKLDVEFLLYEDIRVWGLSNHGQISIENRVEAEGKFTLETAKYKANIRSCFYTLLINQSQFENIGLAWFFKKFKVSYYQVSFEFDFQNVVLLN